MTGIQILVGPGEAVSVVIPDVDKETIVAMLDAFFMGDTAGRGQLAALLDKCPCVTLTLTSGSDVHAEFKRVRDEH